MSPQWISIWCRSMLKRTPNNSLSLESWDSKLDQTDSPSFRMLPSSFPSCLLSQGSITRSYALYAASCRQAVAQRSHASIHLHPSLDANNFGLSVCATHLLLATLAIWDHLTATKPYASYFGNYQLSWMPTNWMCLLYLIELSSSFKHPVVAEHHCWSSFWFDCFCLCIICFAFEGNNWV